MRDSPSLGLDHVSARVRDADAARAFYAGLLGLREMPAPTGALWFGAPPGDPFPCLRLRVDPAAAPGRHGAGQLEETALAVPEGSLPYWTARLDQAGLRLCPTRRFGTPGIRLRDPEGMALLLEESAPGQPCPAIQGLGGSTFWVRAQEADAAVLETGLGCRRAGRDGGLLRLCLGAQRIDLQDAAEFPGGTPGRGVAEHLGLRGAWARLAACLGAPEARLPGGVLLRAA